MKRIFLLAGFLFFNYHQVSAGNLEKAFERLQLYDYFNAKELFGKSMKKDPVAAAYGMSRIHSSEDNPFYNLDSARVYILLCDSLFPLLKEKQKEKYLEFKITPVAIEELKDSICAKAMQTASNSMSLEKLNHYLEKFSFCASQDQVTELRNSIAFQEARSKNTAVSYKYFLDTYPGAQEHKDALNRYQERVFEEETQSRQLGAYELFIRTHPESPYRMEAERMIYGLSTSKGSIAEHKAFINRYPDNRYVRESWREIYRISMENYDEQTYLRFKFDFPDYPFMDELENDYKLQTSLFLPFNKSELWGFVNELGEEMIAPTYEEVNYFSEGLSAVSKDGKFGYITKSGKLVIPFMWDDAEAFKDNCAVVLREDKYGLIGRNGVFIIPVEYDELSEPVEDLCMAMQNEKYGFINKSGHALTRMEFDFASDFMNGFAIIGIDGLYGLINSQGDLVVEAKYEQIQWVSRDLMKASLNGKWGLISRVGEVVLPFLYDAIGEFYDNRALVAQNGKCGFINSRSEIIIPLTYRYTENLLSTAIYKNGYVLLKNTKAKNTLLDTLGVRIQFPGYENTGIPSEGFIPVQKNRKWGYVDYSGRQKISCTYQEVNPFLNSFAIARFGNLFGLIDTSGTWIAEPIYEEISRSGTYFITRLHGMFGLLSQKGVLLAPCEYDRVEIIFDRVAMLQSEDSRSYISLLTGAIIWSGLE